MVVEFTTTYAISAYRHWCCEFESRLGRGVQHNVIKFVSDLRQVGGFLRSLRFPPPIKLTAVALDTIKQTNIHFLCYFDKFNRWNSCLLFSIFSKSPRSIYILLCTYKPYTFSIFNIQSCLWSNKSNKNLSSEKSTQPMSDK